MSAPDGLLVVDKSAGPTSHDVVARTRRLAGTRKVGHAGTLDPAATGVLVLGLGPSTRLLTYVVGSDKEYLATIRLGASTVTDDAEGDVVLAAAPEALAGVDDEAIAAGVGALTGDILQVPSAVSAIKVDGARSYARVRAGEAVDLPPRPVTVSEFVVTGIRRAVDTHPAAADAAPIDPAAADAAPIDAAAADAASIDIDVRVVCSSGTYIRALARDLGAALAVGGHLTSLRRTRVGPFALADAVALDDVDPDPAAPGGVPARLLHPADAATRLFPELRLDRAGAADLGHGRRVDAPADLADDGPLAALAPDGRLIGLAQREGSRLRVLVNFPEAS